MRTSLCTILVALLLAGCSDSPPSSAEPTESDAVDLGPHPTMEKLQFASNAAPLLPAVMSGQPAATFEVPAGTDHLLFALDMAAPSAASPLSFYVVGPTGTRLLEDQAASAGKHVTFVAQAQEGLHQVFAQSETAWDLGLVVTSFPTGMRDDATVYVATPEQTQIEHAFHPDHIEAEAGAATRFVLYDFDPHAGIENLQHNLDFPALDLKTEGKTTWGEVRVLDLPPLQAGEYAFRCEFHGFEGVLTVS